MLHSTASPSSSYTRTTAFLLVLLLFPILIAAQTAEQPIVQAILFYSPTCPHCHQVINEFLIPLQEQYGDQLQIAGIDTSHPAGNTLYLKAIERFEIPQDRLGVPTLIVNDVVLVGSGEIPARFPKLIEDGLSVGGIGWPDIPDLAAIIPDLPPSADPDPKPEVIISVTAESDDSLQDPKPAIEQVTVPSSGDTSVIANDDTAGETGEVSTIAPSARDLEAMGREAGSSKSAIPPADPVGFGLATLVLFGMVMALVYTASLIIRTFAFPAAVSSPAYTLSWAVPILALLGLSVALYLSYVEVAQVMAVCGPVGECNIVQASPYARLMGIPVAVLGVLSYLAVVALWIGQRTLSDRLSPLVLLSLVILTIFGTGFSVYLTAIELFAIRAICVWCLSSAVVTTLLMILVAKSVNNGSYRVKLLTRT
jgi:uncharacterized membrane protein/thiol-disulfide isomerase/thioredoxin